MAKNYTREFKVKACELVIKENISPKVVAEKFAINKVMLYKWVDAYKTDPEHSFVGKGHQKPAEAELKKLQRENETLRQENEILKKAAAYFAKE